MKQFFITSFFCVFLISIFSLTTLLSPVQVSAANADHVTDIKHIPVCIPDNGDHCILPMKAVFETLYSGKGLPQDEIEYPTTHNYLKVINEGDTRRVSVVFGDLGTNQDYYLCLENTDVGAYCPVYNLKSNAKGSLEVIVCGNGNDSLKYSVRDDAQGKDNKSTACHDINKVWFYGGHTYKLRLYDKVIINGPNGPNAVAPNILPLREANFYVSHLFPNVMIGAYDKALKLVATPIGKEYDYTGNANAYIQNWLNLISESYPLFKEAFNNDKSLDDYIAATYIYQEFGKFKTFKGLTNINTLPSKYDTIAKNIDENTEYIKLYEGVTSPDSLTIKLSGRKPGDDKRNNYQIVVEGQDVNYKVTKCTTITNDLVGSNVENKDLVVIKDTAGGARLEAGSYVIKINEQVNDGTIKSKFSGCSGGFTFWEIPLLILKQKVTGSSGAYKYTATVGYPEMDPNESDLDELRRQHVLPISPCAVFDQDECKKVNVALLGNISTNPKDFIVNLFQLILSIAGLGAIFMLVYAGYLFMVSQGDKQKVQNAREIITSVILGLLFIVFSFVILEFIGVDILQIPGLGGSGNSSSSGTTAPPAQGGGAGPK